MEILTVSVAEAAEALGIGETLTRELIEQGELPAVRVARRVLVPVDGLRGYLDRLASEQGAGQG
jgi:excisionase family DNA binding protein